MKTLSASNAVKLYEAKGVNFGVAILSQVANSMLYIIGTHHMNILSVTDYIRIAQKTLLKSRYQRCDLITRHIFGLMKSKNKCDLRSGA